VYELTILSHFSAAHRLRCLHGRCENLHGHNWKIEVSVSSRRLGKEGIILDFGILKHEVSEVLESLDHQYLNDLSYFSRREPSSETIAKYIFDKVKVKLKRHPVTVKRVTAWESEGACATYSET